MSSRRPRAIPGSPSSVARVACPSRVTSSSNRTWMTLFGVTVWICWSAQSNRSRSLRTSSSTFASALSARGT